MVFVRSLLLGLALVVLFLASSPAQAQQDSRDQAFGKIERLDKRLDAILSSDAKLEKLAEGYQWAEGPVWVRDGKYLLFSDVPANCVFQWKEESGARVFLQPSGYTGPGKYSAEPGSNGLLIDSEGRLILCQHGDRRVTRIEKDGTWTTLAERYRGKRLNSPNDIAIKSGGDLYFTDPPYGLPKRDKDPSRQLDFCGVFRISVDGRLTLLVDTMTRPNGIGFSPDEKTLYVAQSDPKQAIWMAFPVRDDGTLEAGRVFYDATKWVGQRKGLPDGLAVDRQGNLFATGPGGVLVFAPDGTLLGRIDTGQATANCTFGEDGSTLYITADMLLCRIRVKTKGIGF